MLHYVIVYLFFIRITGRDGLSMSVRPYECYKG